ncbi:uncharacterized protein LOC116849368 isoform X1 [Odontomachus brunneus]|uniref:uncharacterized protein LOC116849368 isoform X1 n=1 Tax=Odontomachus brunneus TaxID=486640 RepID=UPI0013F24569|nr:uncharacterized protein LOC116849368 isoform X1 [Odontomachus brunneus]XP_032682357.1 uncharacterized protein LOC116849368 isoform X1 [Odontomachus brunneus]XP_032682358.1 uncharacterized protein LOC116849368 isoform X1 [Odontomachus brunneus]XP_032682359.1 uncharacterized protein LOC116849368 isoform X1 [Odontomachus brunneus]XP_032682360.1 uncharacterized protein LOC116849368 isoform X1 [Odontomachus brunneus]
MYEQAASNWAVGLYSLFDPTNFLPFVPHLWNKQVIVSRYPSHTKVRDTDVLVGYLIIFWVTVYLLYEKCLNSLFRRMRFPLVQRNRIIKAVWNCGFCFGSICYMMSSATQILSVAPQEQGMTYQELGIALHKSFYFHQAGINILCHGVWMKGCANLLFASFILNPYRQNYRWCTITSLFLMYKTIDIVIVNICRVLLCILQSAGRPICKIIFLLHCQIWIYLYLYYVPTYMFWSEGSKYARIEPGLWLWFTTECLDSIWLKVFRHAKATHWLEICLFPPPTQEAIELAGIHKRHKESLRKFNNKISKKAELWQTLVCAMAIKKKIKKIRQAKNNNTNLPMEDSEEETDLLQAHVENEISEED